MVWRASENRPLTFEFTPYFPPSRLSHTCGDRQGLHLERIGLAVHPLHHCRRTTDKPPDPGTGLPSFRPILFFIQCIHIQSEFFKTLYLILFLQKLVLQVFVQIAVSFEPRGTVHYFIRVVAESLQRAPSGFVPVQVTVDSLIPVKNGERAFQQCHRVQYEIVVAIIPIRVASTRGSR